MPKPAPRKVHARSRLAALPPAALALAAALVLAALLAGCGGKSTLAPVPDCSGTHLVVFASDRGEPAGQLFVFLYDLYAGGFHALLGFGGTGQDRHPAISPDGTAIAVERPGVGGKYDVLVYDRCAGAFLDRPELVTSADETDPAFSGDTRELAFVRDTLGVPRVRLYDGFSRTFLRLPRIDTLAAHGMDSRSPALDRSGNLIAFVTGASPTRRIELYSRAGDSLFSALDATINSPNDQIDPWLTPDGRYLAFASDRPGGQGGYDIYMYDLQANAYVTLDSLNSTGNDVRPTLSADAAVMVFQSDRTTGPLARGKWDLYNYAIAAKAVSQGFQESSTEDDIEPCLAWP